MKNIFRYTVYFFTAVSVFILSVMMVYLFKEAFPFLKEEGLISFISGKKWYAGGDEPYFGIYNILSAGFYISVLACIISFFFSYGISMFICFYAENGMRKILLWLIGVLSGIPSVIYGFFGMAVILKAIEKTFSMSAGESVLAGSLILSIMIIPFFVSVCVEGIEAVKKSYGKDSLSLGTTEEYFIWKIVLKETRLTVATGFLTAFARAAGETMAVMAVIGNSPQSPALLSKAQTVPSLIALEIGMSEVGSRHYSALFASSFVLLALIMLINMAVYGLNRLRRRYAEV